MDTERLRQAVAGRLDEIIALRRDLHQHPERSNEEEQTAAVVAQRLREAGLSVRAGIGGHGVAAVLGDSGPCIALRADMDALPLQERTGLPWASVNDGVTHACGHDFHTAWLVGTALVLQDLGLTRGQVKFMFQPAEEAICGAAQMLADGVLDDPPVDVVCGAHVWTEAASGQMALRSGPNLAAADRFTITITGAGAHGAHPDRGHDPVPVAAEIIMALQTLVSRRTDPLASAVVSVCQMSAGSAFNIIPAEAVLHGTVRTLRMQDQDNIEERMGRLVTGIAAAHDCEARLEYKRGVPLTVADAEMTELAQRAMAKALGAEHVKPLEQLSMGAEDFSHFLRERPGALLWVGCADPADPEAIKPLHHPGFIGDEGCLSAAMTALAAIALEYLEQ